MKSLGMFVLLVGCIGAPTWSLADFRLPCTIADSITGEPVDGTCAPGCTTGDCFDETDKVYIGRSEVFHADSKPFKQHWNACDHTVAVLTQLNQLYAYQAAVWQSMVHAVFGLGER